MISSIVPSSSTASVPTASSSAKWPNADPTAFSATTERPNAEAPGPSGTKVESPKYTICSNDHSTSGPTYHSGRVGRRL